MYFSIKKKITAALKRPRNSAQPTDDERVPVPRLWALSTGFTYKKDTQLLEERLTPDVG